MHKIVASLAVAATLLAAPAADARTEQTGEEKLARMLEGREAGKPVSCIISSQATETRVIDKTAIVYRIGGTLYVNRPTNADTLDDDDILVTKLHTGQLCRLDTVQLHDRSSFFWNGFVGLQDFVPYRKAKVAAAD